MKTVALLYDHKLNVGGVESHLMGLLRHIPGDLYRFVLISQASDHFAAKVAALGGKVIHYAGWNGLNPLSILALAGILRKEKIDLVHAHSPVAALSGRLAARWLGIPAVVTVHLPVTLYHGQLQTRRARFGRWLYTGLDRILNDRTACLIYVSQKVRDRCVTEGLSPVSNSIVIPVGIPLDEFTPCPDIAALRAQLGAPPAGAGPALITFIGRLSEQKGVDILLEAAKRLDAQQVRFKLWLVGDGPLRARLEQQVRELRLENKVHFWGWQENVAQYLQASDLFVLPSRYEAMPISLLEALACGLPVVVTKVGENETIVQAEANGLLVAPENAAELAEALARLINSADLRQEMAKNALSLARQFDEVTTAKQVEKVYQRFLLIKSARGGN